jgi:hypothetical protein
MNTSLQNASRAEILAAFGYVITGAGPVSAYIAADPEAFTVKCFTYSEALDEAYTFLFNEVDPALYLLPSPESFNFL